MGAWVRAEMRWWEGSGTWNQARAWRDVGGGHVLYGEFVVWEWFLRVWLG